MKLAETSHPRPTDIVAFSAISAAKKRKTIFNGEKLGRLNFGMPKANINSKPATRPANIHT
jgi:hypothetical protein